MREPDKAAKHEAAFEKKYSVFMMTGRVAEIYELGKSDSALFFKTVRQDPSISLKERQDFLRFLWKYQRKALTKETQRELQMEMAVDTRVIERLRVLEADGERDKVRRDCTDMALGYLDKDTNVSGGYTSFRGH